jgi:hypothetical protein
MCRRRKKERDREVGIPMESDLRGLDQQTGIQVGLVRGPPNFAIDAVESATGENC